jgi:hypothetical protein
VSKLLVRAGDRLLDKLVGRVEAGACVPENGQTCYCRFSRIYKYNCNGACYMTSVFC